MLVRGRRSETVRIKMLEIDDVEGSVLAATANRTPEINVSYGFRFLCF